MLVEMVQMDLVYHDQMQILTIDHVTNKEKKTQRAMILLIEYLLTLGLRCAAILPRHTIVFVRITP
jgi:hypothetical protein